MNTVTPIREGTDAVMHSIEAEQGILGGLLLAPELSGAVDRLGGADLFHDPVHALIFSTICAKSRAGELSDLVTVGLALEDHPGFAELGGPRYLVRMAGASIGPNAIKGYAEALAELARKRQIQAAISAATADLARADMKASDVSARLDAAMLAMGQIGDSSGPVSMLRAVKESLDMVQAAYQGDFTHVVKSGIAPLDSIIPGFFPGELTLLGGRPAMGKSAVALSIALNAARAGHGVAIASLEMTPEGMAMRALSEATAAAGKAVAYTDMRRGRMAEDEFRHVYEQAHAVSSLPIYFLPRKFADAGSMLSGVRQIARASDLKLLIVDYAQLMTAQGRSRYEQITAISLALKGMAVSLNIPVIALSQLSRKIEERDDKRPVMSDLRESGQLEQDADNILFCYRPEYYLGQAEPTPEDSAEAHAKWHANMDAARGRLEIIVAKQRMGETGTARCRCALATNSVWGDDFG